MLCTILLLSVLNINDGIKSVKKIKQMIESVGGHFNKRNRPINQVSVIDIVNAESKIESANFIRSNFSQALLFDQLEDIHNYIITQLDTEGLLLEFGVYSARSIKRFSKQLVNLNDKRIIYGFDSFQGIEEDWHRFPAKLKSSFKIAPPKVPSNVKLVIGKVQETFENFLNQHQNEKIAFMHLDMDTYTPTKYVLNKIKPLLTKGSIILFDEFYGFPNWKSNEYKAFTEVFDENEYKYLAFGNRQVAIEIL